MRSNFLQSLKKFLILSTFDKHDKTQLLAKFKKILYMGFRATLNFRKFKVALNPMYRIFLNFAKSCVLSCLSNVDNIQKFTVPFLNYKPLEMQLRVFLATNTVALVTYCITKMITTCSPMVGQFFDTMIVTSSDKEWS